MGGGGVTCGKWIWLINRGESRIMAVCEDPSALGHGMTMTKKTRGILWKSGRLERENEKERMIIKSSHLCGFGWGLMQGAQAGPRGNNAPLMV